MRHIIVCRFCSKPSYHANCIKVSRSQHGVYDKYYYCDGCFRETVFYKELDDKSRERVDKDGPSASHG